MSDGEKTEQPTQRTASAPARKMRRMRVKEELQLEPQVHRFPDLATISA